MYMNVHKHIHVHGVHVYAHKHNANTNKTFIKSTKTHVSDPIIGATHNAVRVRVCNDKKMGGRMCVWTYLFSCDVV